MSREGQTQVRPPDWASRSDDQLAAEESFERTLVQRSRKLSSRYRPLPGFTITQLRAEVLPERFEAQVNPTKHSLLVSSNVAEIAHVAGFADQSHLTRVLRQYTGLTPKAFRSL